MATAASTRVTSISALQTAINGANPGDTITLANGSYTASATIGISRAGSATAPITIMPDTVGGATISWQLISVGSGYHRIMARHSGKAMVVQSASTADGGNVIQWTYGGTTTNDEWAPVSIGSGYYKLVNRHSGKVLGGGGWLDGEHRQHSTVVRYRRRPQGMAARQHPLARLK